MRVCVDKIVGVELTATQSPGGILIPATHVDTRRTATKRLRVVQVGPGYFSDQLDRRISVAEQVGHAIEPGDIIVVSRYVYEHELDGVKYRVCQATDILAIEDRAGAEPEDYCLACGNAY